MSYFSYIRDTKDTNGKSRGEAAVPSLILISPPDKKGISYELRIKKGDDPELIAGVLRELGAAGIARKNGRFTSNGILFGTEETVENEAYTLLKGTLFGKGMADMRSVIPGITMAFLIGSMKYAFEKRFGKAAAV